MCYETNTTEVNPGNSLVAKSDYLKDKKQMNYKHEDVLVH